MPEFLFSYGTLQQSEVQMASFGRLLTGKPDVLPGWRQVMVEITDADVIAKSGKTRHPIVVAGRDGDRVAGTVFEITSQELTAADRYEVAEYKRVSVKLASGLIAWVYVKA